MDGARVLSQGPDTCLKTTKDLLGTQLGRQVFTG